MSSQRRPAKSPGASVDLQSRGLSLVGTSVPDAPQPREDGAVLPREPRCLPHPRAAQEEGVTADHGQGHPAPHKSAQLAVVALPLVRQEVGDALFKGLRLPSRYPIHGVDQGREGAPPLGARLQILKLFDAGAGFKDLCRIHVVAPGGGVTVDHLRVENCLLPSLPQPVHQHVAAVDSY